MKVGDTVRNMTSIFCTLTCIDLFMLNEQKMSYWNRFMKCSIAAALFMAHLGMAVERKLEQCLKRFVETSRCSFVKHSFGVRCCVGGSVLSS